MLKLRLIVAIFIAMLTLAGCGQSGQTNQPDQPAVPAESSARPKSAPDDLRVAPPDEPEPQADAQQNNLPPVNSQAISEEPDASAAKADQNSQVSTEDQPAGGMNTSMQADTDGQEPDAGESLPPLPPPPSPPSAPTE